MRIGEAEILARLDGTRFDFQGLAVVGDGLVEPSASGQSVAQVVVGLGEVGLDFQGLLVLGDGLVELSAVGQKLPRLLWASA